jgi:uncharacterized protein (DUF4415 family)
LTDNWEYVKRMSDEEIEARALADPDNPPTDEAFWKYAKIVWPEKKKLTALRLDPDVLAWFRSHGKGYQTRINAVLRAYMKAQQR